MGIFFSNTGTGFSSFFTFFCLFHRHNSSIKKILGVIIICILIILGLLITVTGQLIRGATIGLAYIIRGGKEGKVYAEELVTTGIFNHCRNPLYVGNILMLFGVGVLSNSLLYVA